MQVQEHRTGIRGDIAFWIEIVSYLKAHQRLQVLPGSQRLCSLIRASLGIPKTRPLSLMPSTLL